MGNIPHSAPFLKEILFEIYRRHDNYLLSIRILGMAISKSAPHKQNPINKKRNKWHTQGASNSERRSSSWANQDLDLKY